MRGTVLLSLVLAWSPSCALPPPGQAAPGQAEVSAQSGPSGCSSNLECKGGRVCHEGACIPPADPTAVKRIEAGGADLASLEKLIQSRTCVPAPGVNAVLRMASTEETVVAADLKARMAHPSIQYPELIGDWLLAARKYLRGCGMDEQASAVKQAAERLAAVVGENTVEDAVRRVDCGALAMVNEAKMWPYEQRFSSEIVARRFGDAEVTRRVWTETLTTFNTECIKRLNTRERIAIRAQLDSLERIIGLDDPMLIDLRSKLLHAMEKGDANTIATLSSAISQREGVLDQRHTNDQVKQLDIRYRIAEKKRQMAEAELAAAKRGGGQGASAIADARGAVQTTQDAVDTAQDAIQTAKNVHDTVNMARSLFGF